MDVYKVEFIEFLLSTGALKVFENPKEDRTLKSGRLSPWFVNIGSFDDGDSSGPLAGYFADAIIEWGKKWEENKLPFQDQERAYEVLYGIPDKGVGLAPPIAIAMAQKGHNVAWCFSRKDEKKHGEASNLPPDERIKALIVGHVPKEKEAIVQIDDVFTAGDAKYEANSFLTSLGRNILPLLAIAVDRQEVAIDSKNAIAEYTQKTKTKVISIVNAVEVYEILKDNKKVSDRALERLATYIRVYGTDEARKEMGKIPEHKIMTLNRSVIPACDVATLDDLVKIVASTAENEKIGGYKIGFELGLAYGLPNVVNAIRGYSDKPIIYDHQKAGTDIPDTGRNFAKVCKKAGVDAVILFPESGPETERAWILHALDNDLKVIVGGWMTHKGYAVSEGGFIADQGIIEMYRIAASIGVNNFVVPGNKVHIIQQIKNIVEAEGINPIFYSPGFIAQGGKLSAAAEIVGFNFHGIVGRGIYQAADMKQAAIEHTIQI